MTEKPAESPTNLESNHRDIVEWVGILAAALLGAITAVIFFPHIFDGITLFGGPAPRYAHPILLEIFLFPGGMLYFAFSFVLDGLPSSISFEGLFLLLNVIGYAILAYIIVLTGRFVSKKRKARK